MQRCQALPRIFPMPRPILGTPKRLYCLYLQRISVVGETRKIERKCQTIQQKGAGRSQSGNRNPAASLVPVSEMNTQSWLELCSTLTRPVCSRTNAVDAGSSRVYNGCFFK